jgi:hypothetical protein
MRSFRRPTQRRQARRSTGRLINRYQPSVESLEDRTLLSVSISGLPNWVPAGPDPIDNVVTNPPVPPDNAAGGAIQSVAVDPYNSFSLWVGTTNGGVWRTTSADPYFPSSVQWTPMTDKLPSLAIGSVAVDPLDISANTVWAGTGDFTNGGDYMSPNWPGLADGLWRTTDGGATWVNLGQNLTGFRVEKVLPTGLLGPGGKEVVLAATTDGGGLYRSPDDGATFNAVLPGVSVMGLIQDPNTPGTFYATVAGKGTTPSGIYKSTDAGATWALTMENGLGNLTPSAVIEITPQNVNGSTVLYAGVENVDPSQPPGSNADILTGVYVSLDGGNNWGALPTPPRTFDAGTNQSPAPFSIVADPFNAGVVYIAGQAGSMIRRDLTTNSWVSIIGANANNTAPHVDDHGMTFMGSNVLLEVDDGGIYYLKDPTNPAVYGWQSFIGNLGNVEFYHTTLDTSANVIFGGAQDNGVSVQTAPFSSVWNMVQGGDGSSVAYDALGGVRYALSNNLAAFTHNNTPVLLDADGIEHPISFASDAGPIEITTDSTASLADGDGVVISGVQGNTAANGTFAVQVVDSTHFNLVSQSIPTGNGTYTTGGVWRKLGLNPADVATVTTAPGFIMSPVVVNPVRADALLLTGLTGVYESFDEGDTIQEITGNLHGLNVNTSGFGAPHYALAYGGFQAGLPESNVAYVGTDQGQLFYRGTSGSSFTPLSGPTLPQLPIGKQRIWSIITDPQDWRRVYVVVGTTEETPGAQPDSVYMCNDVTHLSAADPFINITYNLTNLTSNFRSITLADGVPLVGALDGVYRLLGTTWTLYGNSLPNVLVSDVSYHPSTANSPEQVLAGTYGRGAWQLFYPIFTVATPGDLQINVSADFAGQTNVVRLRLDPNLPNLLDVFANSSTPTASFPLDAIQEIDVNSLSGNNTIIVDFSNGVISVPGGIHVTGKSGTLQLQAIGTIGNESIQITSTGLNVAGEPIAYSGVSGLEVDTGSGGAAVNVNSTSTPLTIKPGAGSNLISFGQAGGNLNAINGTVNIDQGTSPFALDLDSLYFYDNQNSSAETWIIGSNVIARGSLVVNYFDRPTLTVFAGTGNNVFAVFSTPGSTTINANSFGSDTVNLTYGGLGGAFRFNGFSGNNVTDTLTINDTGDSANVAWICSNLLFEGGSGNQVVYTALEGVTLNAGKGNNTFAVESTAVNAPFALNTGAGNDTINVGISRSLAFLRAAVTVTGQGGTDSLVLNDQSNTTQMSYDISATQIVRTTSTFLPSILYSGIATLALNAGGGNDNFTVESTPAAVTVNGGAGTNNFRVEGAAAALTVNTGSGNDMIALGGLIFGNLNGIRAPVTIDGQGGTDTLVLNDQTNPLSTEYEITATSVVRIQGSQLPAIFYTRMAGLTLNAGTVPNSFFVETTALNTPVTVNTGSGNDTISFGLSGSLAGILSAVTVNGQGGNDLMFFNGQRDTSATTYYLVTGLVEWVTSISSPLITYNNIAALTLNAGAGSNTIYVETAASTAVTVDASANNTIALGGIFLGHVAGINVPVTIFGVGSTDQVILNDQGNFSTADQLTATGSGVKTNPGGSFFGPGGSLAYSAIGTVTIDTSNSSRGSSITVFPAGGMIFNVFGAGADNSLVVEPFNGAPVMQHGTGTAGSYTPQTTSTILVNYSDMQSVTPVGLLAVGSGSGLPPDVQVYDPESGTLKFDLHPFASDFRGGARVAVGDVNGDGIPDIVTAQGPGGGNVEVFDGSTGLPLAGPLGSFTPFGPDYHRGLWVAAADVNGDGLADVIVGQDAGGQPEVRIYSGKDGSLLADFLAFDPSFQGGVRVAAAVIKGHHDVIAGQGPGGQAVNVFDGATLNLANHNPTPAFTITQPFGLGYAGGVFVGTGDVYGDGTPKILVGQGSGADPQIGLFDGTAQGQLLKRFVVYGFTDGVRVAAADLNGDSRADVIAAEAHGGSNVRAYDGLTLQEVAHLNAFAAASPGGVFVGGFGHWGDFANLAGRTLSGPQGELQAAAADLATIQGGLANGRDRSRLAGALDLLYAAFNSPAWVNSSHLQADGGRDVFADEEAAVEAIADLIRHSEGTVPGQQLENDLRQVGLSAEELAQIALAGAEDGGSRKLGKAQAALRKGQDDFAAAFAAGGFNPDRLDEALAHFRAAWEDTLNA